MTTEPEKSPREIADSIAVRGLPFSAFINSVQYRNAQAWIAKAIAEALRNERERCARIAQTIPESKFDLDHEPALSETQIRKGIAAAIRGKS